MFDSKSRGVLEHKLAAEIEWELFRYQTLYRDSRCVSDSETDSKSAWLTYVQGDDVSIVQAVVLGHMLQKLSCISERLAAVSDKTNSKITELLHKAGYKVLVLPDLSCDGLSSDHVILNAWNLTQYNKIVYLDTATFPTLSLDEVFDTVQLGKISAPYQSPSNVADVSFSGSMFGLVPDVRTFSEMLAQFQDRSKYKCHDVAGFLWYFFTQDDRWLKLPYSYNIRNDRYFPMKSFNSREVSRLGPVWEWQSKPTRQQAEKIDKPLASLEDLYEFWWVMLYEGLERAESWHWWHYESTVYWKFLHSDPVRDFRAVDIY